jgi:hypothetical protein
MATFAAFLTMVQADLADGPSVDALRGTLAAGDDDADGPVAPEPPSAATLRTTGPPVPSAPPVRSTCGPCTARKAAMGFAVHNPKTPSIGPPTGLRSTGRVF